MNDELQIQAKSLADRPYFQVVIYDETTDGSPCHVAFNPELEGCMAQGRTPKEAEQNLTTARFDFILSLLQDGLPVPPPQQLRPTVTVLSGTSVISGEPIQFYKPLFSELYEIQLPT